MSSMQYIDEMYPWSIVDFKKYCTYLALRKERDKFIKSLSNKRSCDWLIEKKLLDAGGLGDHVYLYLARGQSRQRFMEEYLELLESGRDVTVVSGGKVFRKSPKMDVDDLDLFVLPAWRKQLNDEINQHIFKQFNRQLITEWTDNYLYPMELKPIARPDAYIYSDKYIWDLSWTIRPDGSLRLNEISIIPNPERGDKNVQ